MGKQVDDSFRVRPGLMVEGSNRYQAAVVLLAPLMAMLTRDEQEEVVGLIQASTKQAVLEALYNFERASAVCVCGPLITRFAARSGMDEAGEVLAAAATYLNADNVMPPPVAVYEDGVWNRILKGLAIESSKRFFDWLNDAVSKVGLKTSPEYPSPKGLTDDMLPSVLGGVQSPGWRRGCYDVMTQNIQPLAADE
jgi:hypothetical protein